MSNDILKKLLEADSAAPATVAPNPIIAKLIDKGDKVPSRPHPILPLLVSHSPFAVEEKQNGPVSVVAVTPYGATDANAIVKAIAEINKDIGKVGRVFHEGSFEVGRLLPKLMPKLNIEVCVRDRPGNLLAFKHLGGGRPATTPMEEVRERLDDDDRLLRAGELDAMQDMIDMATGAIAMVVMPGSARMAAAERLAIENGLVPVHAIHESTLKYADDFDVPLPPVTVLIVTKETYTNVPALLMARLHLGHLGRKVGKIIHTPSIAMEVLAGISDGTLYHEVSMEEAQSNPFQLFKDNPDFAVVAGQTPLTTAVAKIAVHSSPPVPCAELE